MGEKTTVGRTGMRLKCAINFIGGVHISMFTASDKSKGKKGKRLLGDKRLKVQGVKDGDELEWTFGSEMKVAEQITVKLVSECDEAEVQTVTLAKGVRLRNLAQYLQSLHDH